MLGQMYALCKLVNHMQYIALSITYIVYMSSEREREKERGERERDRERKRERQKETRQTRRRHKETRQTERETHQVQVSVDDSYNKLFGMLLVWLHLNLKLHILKFKAVILYGAVSMGVLAVQE